MLEGAQFLVRYLTLSAEDLSRCSGLLSPDEAGALSAMVSGCEDGFEMPDHLADLQMVMRTHRTGGKHSKGKDKRRFSRASLAR